MTQSHYDVIVAGGGTAGVAAAIAAGRNGAKTLLIDKNGHLGGSAVTGIPFLGVFDGQNQQVVKGLLEEIVQRLIQEKGSIGHVIGARWSNNGHMEGDAFVLTPFDSEIYKYVAQEMVLEAGADLLLHTWIADVLTDDNRVTGLSVLNKSGTREITADVIIDTTGDADICAFAGAEMIKKERVQNSTMLFTLTNVDTEMLYEALQKGDNVEGWGWWHSRIVKSKKLDGDDLSVVHLAGHFKPFEDDTEITFTAVSGREGEIYLNATRTINIDATSGESLTTGEISERRNVMELTKAIVETVPGFQKAYISKTAPIGIRESRSIVGDYILTGEDVFNGKTFDDVICRGAYPSDIHDPKGGRTQFTFIKGGGSYGIPYRSLLPKGLENVIVAGRAISANQEAGGTIRLQGTVVAHGQAAGTAAALAVAQKTTPRGLPVQDLQERLKKQGAVL